MARCNLDALLDTIGEDKLTKQNEVTFTVHKDLPDCRKIDTKNFTAIGGGYSYNKYNRPDNKFECLRTGCVNSGTLTLTTASEEVTYFAPYDATEWAAGVITFYVNKAGTITVQISDDSDFENADKYTVTINDSDIGDDGFAPVVIDLSTEGTDVDGGWTALTTGAYIKISSSVASTGVSSISIFESIYDFEVNDTVKVTCLSEIGGSFDVDALESTCLSAGYDDTVSSFEYTVTGNKVTPNYWVLNPMVGKGENTVGYYPNTVEKTVIEYDDNDNDYGYVRLSDAYQDECGYFAVEIADECNITDAYLTQLSVPTLTTIDDGHYQVIKNSDGTTDIFVSSALVGKTLKVSYPQEVEIIDELVGNTDNLNTVRTRMTVPRTTTDGVRYLLVFENVLVTSFPATINTDETEFSFTITIEREPVSGNFFHRQRISTSGVTTPSWSVSHA